MPDLSDHQHAFAWGVQSLDERRYILSITKAPLKYASYYWNDLPPAVRRKVGLWFRDGEAPGLKY